MNINSIQPEQVSQNMIKSAERSGSSAEHRPGTVSMPAASVGSSSQVSEAAIAAGVGFLQEQLQTLLTSFPPFFPAGSYQRADLIRGVKTLEEQIGKSSVDENLKKMISGKKLTDDSSDDDISASLDRLFAVMEEIVKKMQAPAEPLKPGLFLSVKA